MLTRKLPTGAGALKSDIGEVDLGLIGLAATALALAPKRKLIDALAHPLGWIRQVPSCLFRGFIGRERKDLFFGKVQRSVIL